MQISENMEIGYNVKDMCPASSKEVSVRSSQADENEEDKLKIEVSFNRA